MPKYIHDDNIACLSTSTDETPISINLVNTEDFGAWQDDLSEAERAWANANGFTGKHGELIKFVGGNGQIGNITVAMDSDKVDPWFFSKIASALNDGLYKVVTELDDNIADMAVFGWAMAHYKFDAYLKDKNEKNAVLIVPENCNIDQICAVIKGTNLTRDLVNIPTCDMGPTELADAAEELANQYNANYQVTVGAELLEKGYETIHTVGRAAAKEPRLIDITWGNENAPKVTLIGKGVCFDTGGLDIKPSNAMLIMKKDMGGAAHVLGLAQMIMEVGLNIRLRVLIPAVENNISADAFRPGDIIKSYEGTTIEVGNTDAEGRLVLCDAIALASEEKPDLMLDFATLTGAARVATGADVPPYFTDDKNLSTQLLELQETEHDPLWPLPLYAPYKKMLASNIADINNVGSSGFGGAITAALFLQHFVGKDIPWAHFDIYAWNASDRPGKPKGGEAMGLRTVFAYLSAQYG